MKKFKIILTILFVVLAIAVTMTIYSLAKYTSVKKSNVNAKIARPTVNLEVKKFDGENIIHPYAIVTVTNFTEEAMNDVTLNYEINLDSEDNTLKYNWYDMNDNLVATNDTSLDESLVHPLGGTVGYEVKETYQYKLIFVNTGNGDGLGGVENEVIKDIDFLLTYVQANP
ncbi:MAG: hypothetical protein LBL91_04225 [Lachnospiraceae bacterium]|jgi:hypothetical protein|nr:hypothetical protein [Lachnospiraceae bacterium]